MTANPSQSTTVRNVDPTFTVLCASGSGAVAAIPPTLLPPPPMTCATFTAAQIGIRLRSRSAGQTPTSWTLHLRLSSLLLARITARRPTPSPRIAGQREDVLLRPLLLLPPPPHLAIVTASVTVSATVSATPRPPSRPRTADVTAGEALPNDECRPTPPCPCRRLLVAATSPRSAAR